VTFDRENPADFRAASRGPGPSTLTQNKKKTNVRSTWKFMTKIQATTTPKTPALAGASAQSKPSLIALRNLIF
jgi:hypothetical protein